MISSLSDHIHRVQEERERAKERRIAFQTMSEILSIKQDGGDILRHFDISLLQSFNSGAGKDPFNADVWIRKEISDNLDNLRKHSYVGKDTIESTAEIFLTCDLMNALGAVAENINTLYFYRIEHDLKIDYESLGLLIVNTAVQLDECKCTFNIPGKSITTNYCASWPGKSGLDWQNNFVLERDCSS